MQCLYTRYPVATGGLYPPPPQVVTLSHSPFPIFPIDWTHEGELALFPLLCYAPHVMFWEQSNKEILAGHALSTVAILNSAVACCVCSGKSGRQFILWRVFFCVFPDLFWQLRKFHCQRLLIRSVTGRMYGPALVHLAFVWCAIDISFSKLLVVEWPTEFFFFFFYFSFALNQTCQFEMLHQWLHHSEISPFPPLT